MAIGILMRDLSKPLQGMLDMKMTNVLRLIVRFARALKKEAEALRSLRANQEERHKTPTEYKCEFIESERLKFTQKL